MYPKPHELLTESDVEQKLVLPLLTTPAPAGLQFSVSDLATKLSTRRLEIGKGTARKLYFPDYTIVLAGLPIMVVEVKTVGESLDAALDEARLYAQEINALYPHGINPCVRVIACNGEALATAPVDSALPDATVLNDQLSLAYDDFSKFVDLCNREVLQQHVDQIRKRMRPRSFGRAVGLVGGVAFQNEELPQNTFGATIAGDYGHIFNPRTREDRARIAREAYIGSLRQQRYVEPIDRLVRNAVAPIAAKLKPLDNSARPDEITSSLRDRKNLENQLLLLVGSVGAGKSTFVDYLSLVALPPELREKTIWLRIDLNQAPLAVDAAYEWLAGSVVEEFRAQNPNVDFDAYDVLEKIFRHELGALKKGPLAVLEPDSVEYRVRIADRLSELQSAPLAMAKGIASYLCSGPNLLLVIVLDNCDKRTRDEQLRMFQVAQWVQSEFRCLVVLPLRDVTFDMHRYDRPLDTALKQFIFRIEPPPFSDVLQARVRLALKEIARTSGASGVLSYQLPNGINVSYPAEDQALYLASILRSLYAHDRFVRQVITGLAGRDVRRALEIFLEFCMSGHIGEDEIFRIRFFQGQHVLPLSVVARVLLRMQRRFYDGNRSFLKNIVQCDPDDPLPDHFVRLAILHWFERKLKLKGPAGVEGFHRVSDLVLDLVTIGHDALRVRKDLLYLAREGCLIPEHLKADHVEDSDLVKISAAGVVHLQLLVNPEYLAACAEDTWIADPDLCARVAARISEGPEAQFSRMTTARNATEFVEYLKARSAKSVCAPEVFLQEVVSKDMQLLREAEAGVAASDLSLPDRLFIGNVHFDTTEQELRDALAEHKVSLKSITFPRSNGKNRGFAFVDPTTKNEVLTALELDGAIRLRGRRLKINEAHPLEEDHVKKGGREHPLPDLSTRVYITSLPYSFKEADVRALLAENDLTPVTIVMLTDRKTGKSLGACLVELRTLDDSAKAIGALGGLKCNDRRLIARPAEPRRN